MTITTESLENTEAQAPVRKHSRFTKWEWVLLVISVIYIIFESSFFVNLVDVIAADSVHLYEDLDKVGRTLSGIGLAILVLKHMTAKYAFNTKALITRILAAILAFSFAYYGQKALVDTLVNNLSVDQKSQMVRGYMFQKTFTNEVIKFNTSHLEEYNRANLIQKALLAPVVLRYAENKRPNVSNVDKVLDREFQNNTVFYYKQYHNLLEETYVPLMDAHKEARRRILSEVHKQSDRAWNEVARQAYRGRNRYQPNELARLVRQQVRKELGFSLPTSWRPSSEGNHKRVFREHFVKHHEPDVFKKMQKVFQDRLGIRLTNSDPNKCPNVIKFLNEKYGVFALEGRLLGQTSLRTFTSTYKDVFPKNLRKMYDDYRSNEYMQDMSVRLFLVPFLALTFSGIFLVFNALSLISDLLLKFAFNDNNGRGYKHTKYCLMTILIILPFLLPYYSVGSQAMILKLISTENVFYSMGYKYLISITYFLHWLINGNYIQVFENFGNFQEITWATVGHLKTAGMWFGGLVAIGLIAMFWSVIYPLLLLAIVGFLISNLM